jgi:hypothetical protein
MADLTLLSKLGKVMSFEKDQVLFMQYEPGDCMYLVLTGAFGVYIDSFTDFPMRVAGIDTPGAFFGEMAVIDGSPRSASIIAEENSNALVIDKEHFEELLTNSPEVADGILNLLVSRADTMAQNVRKCGLEAPDLPAQIRAQKAGDIKMKHMAMVLLAGRIRELNQMIISADTDETIKEAVLKGPVALLPKGHIRYDIEDENDNSIMVGMKKSVCPYCRMSFEAPVPLFSHIKHKETTLEQRIIYKDFNILWYTNVVCPNCNYTDTYREFSKLEATLVKPKYKGNQFENMENFTGYKDPRKHTLDEVILSYYQNIECLKRTSGDHLRLGKAWIRLYWIYSDCLDNENKNTAANEAISAYNEFKNGSKNNLGTEDYMKLNIILGELSVAVGNIESAAEYYKENARICKLPDNSLLRQSLQRYSEITKS